MKVAIKSSRVFSTLPYSTLQYPSVPYHKTYQLTLVSRIAKSHQYTGQLFIRTLSSVVVEKSTLKLRSLVNTCEEWESKAKLCLQARYV